ncbi:nucleotide exchange factor GrpE [Alkaliphilus crotonatoxidans]
MEKQNQEEILDEQLEETADSNLEAVQEETEEAAEATEEVDEIAKLKKQIEEKEAALQDYINQMQRLQADFANYKKRIEKEKSEIYLYANEKLAEELLGTMDNLERALEAASEEQETGLFQGIELVLKQLKELLKRNGVEEIEALNQPFDMNLHHAVAQEEAEAEANTIIEVFQKGYKIHQKVLRPAMVKVAK